MATSFFDPLLRLFDSLGEIIAGGSVYTYEAGTTTPKATYQDLAGATPNTNPVVLDAGGSGTIRLTNGSAYKLIVKDSSGVTVWTEDNIVVGEADAGSPYLVCIQFLGDSPTAQQIVGKHVFGYPVEWVADLSNSVFFDVGDNPTGDAAFDMQKNGVSFGTLTIDTNGAVSVDSDAVTFGVGDAFTLITPDSGTDLTDLAGTINGTVA